MAQNRITLLKPRIGAHIFSKLVSVLDESKQAKASPGQWAATVCALTQKGVKGIEISESEVLEWLGTKAGVAPEVWGKFLLGIAPGKKDNSPEVKEATAAVAEAGKTVEPITRDDLVLNIQRKLVSMKEIVLGTPKYGAYRQVGGNYIEILYVAHSELDDVKYELLEIESQMIEMSTDMDALFDNPEKVIELENSRAALMAHKAKAIDFTHHHFSDKITGEMGRNLVAHCRVTRRPEIGLYFIEEIQSDWAQKGRKNNWGENYPKGPLVTNTEAWAGFVLRRQLQVAALDPEIRHVAWLTGSMSNGARQDLMREEQIIAMRKLYAEQHATLVQAKLDAIGGENMTPEQLKSARDMASANATTELQRRGVYEVKDQHDEFYLRIITKLADKLLAGTGEKVGFVNHTLVPGYTVKVPGFTMTDKVREHLRGSQPLYSRARVLAAPRSETDPAVVQAMRNAREMLGSSLHRIRLFKRLTDIALCKPVSGSVVDRSINISLSSVNPAEVMNHEVFHFAQKHMLDSREKDLVRRAFAPGSKLNHDVVTLALKDGNPELAQQCQSDPDEAAAQGFAYWQQSRLDVTEEAPAAGIFNSIADAVRIVSQYVRKLAFDQKLQTVTDVFVHLSDGDLAQRQEHAQAQQARIRQSA